MAIDWLEVAWCFGETYKLSYKTMATFNLNNIVYYEDLSLFGVLWKMLHIFAVITVYPWEFKPVTTAARYLMALRHLKLIILQRCRDTRLMELS